MRVGPGTPGAREVATQPEEPCPGRHCWVGDAVDGRGTKRPGLLAEWRQDDAGWWGRVVYVALVRPGEWGLVEEWLPSHRLTQH